MNIVYDEEYKSFHLYNEKISYVMKIEKNCYLSHCYFGKRIRRWNEAAKMYYYDRGFCANPDETDRTFSLDTMPGEYPDFGQGDFRSPAMELEFQDGDRNTRFHYAGYQISAGKLSPEKLPHVYVESDKEAMTLEIWMKDEVRGLRLSLYYTIYEDAVLTRFVSIKNESEDIVKIHRLLSMSLDLGEQDYDILTLGGAHTEEKNVYRRHLLGDSIVVESSRGTSSPQATPFLGIMRKETTEEQGEVFGANLIYSGNFWGCVQCGQYGTTRVQLGINPFQFCWNLKPGEQFDTPETVLVYSTEGLGGMSAIFHRLYRKRVCRGKFREKERPVLLNSWEGMYFAISEEKMLELADTAVEAGIELLVMDDGWFRGRNSDTTSLGDWIEDQEKFPEGDGGDAILNFLESNQELTVYYAPGPRITYIDPKKLKRLYALHPVMHLNELEALTSTNTDDITQAAEILSKSTGNTVLITLGKQGVHLFENGTHALVSSKQATVVDTIGAGDSHIGSVIAMRTMGHSFLEAISTANRIAAKVVSVKGPIITTEEFENAKQDET